MYAPPLDQRYSFCPPKPRVTIVLDVSSEAVRSTANLRTKILDFRGFDSSIILIVRGGIPRPVGNFPESYAYVYVFMLCVMCRCLEDSLGSSAGCIGGCLEGFTLEEFTRSY